MSGEERDEKNAICKASQQAAPGFQRQAALAAAAGSQDGEQAASRIEQAPLDFRQLALAPDERRERGGQVGIAGGWSRLTLILQAQALIEKARLRFRLQLQLILQGAAEVHVACQRLGSLTGSK